MSTLYLCGAGNSEGVRLAQTINQQQSRWQRIVLLDDDPKRHGQTMLGVEIAGPFALLAQANAATDEVVNMVARTTVKRWAARCKIAEYGVPFATLISASIDTAGAEFGRDLIVYHNATVGPLVAMGEGTVAFMGSVVGHGSQLGRGCVVAPNAVINARVQLGDGVYVGSNATILPEVKVGPWVTIGAGTVVTHHVPAGATVMGVPSKTVLTLGLKLKMGAFACLPQEMRQALQQQAQPVIAHSGAGSAR
jgi:sugar O-acyltransferase (sialic acid O-acetyltransferase NeuD family)